MRQNLKMCAMKLGTSFLLMGTMASAFAGQSAFAQSGYSSSASSTTNCETTASTVFDAGPLNFISDPTAMRPQASITSSNQHHFRTKVTDQHNSTIKWKLQTSSQVHIGLSGTIVPLFLGDATSTVKCEINATCPTTVAYTPVQLTNINTTFVDATTTTTVNGVEDLTSVGYYTFTSTEVLGTYQGNILLTLVNAG